MGKRRNGTLFGLTLLSAAGHAAACTEDRIDVRTANGFTTYSIEIADDHAERAQGLMFRESMARDSR